MTEPAHDSEPYVKIEIQPASLRFRYATERRCSAPITGKIDGTSPTIRLINYEGEFVVTISCVTKDKPYFTHPHNIVERTKKAGHTQQLNEESRDSTSGVYQRVFTANSSRTIEFTSLAIQCVKKDDVLRSLENRQKRRIDPFKAGYQHMDRTADIDLSAIRLCFQVFLTQDRKVYRVLKPVASDVIYDRKVMTELRISRLSHTIVPAAGGHEMILLCNKISKKGAIQVYFYAEDDNGTLVWQEEANIISLHKMVAICFTSPDCRAHLSDDVTLHPVKIQLRRRLGDETEEGEGCDLFLEIDSCRKRRRPNYGLHWSLQPDESRGQMPVCVVAVPQYVQSPPQDGVPPNPMSSYPAGTSHAYGDNPQLAVADHNIGRTVPVYGIEDRTPFEVPDTSQRLTAGATGGAVGGFDASYPNPTQNWETTRGLYAHGQNAVGFYENIQYNGQEGLAHVPMNAGHSSIPQANGHIAGHAEHPNRATDHPDRISFDNLTLNDPPGGVNVSGSNCKQTTANTPTMMLANGYYASGDAQLNNPGPSSNERSHGMLLEAPIHFSTSMYSSASSEELVASPNLYNDALPANPASKAEYPGGYNYYTSQCYKNG